MVCMFEQLSLFDLVQDRQEEETAVSCMTGRKSFLKPLEDWMKKLIPEGIGYVTVGEHPMVLRPTKLSRERIPEGHTFYHYEVENAVYSGIFVGNARD